MRSLANRIGVAVAVLGLVLGMARGGEAALISVAPGDFDASATVITFETGSTALPSVPGATFVTEGAVGSPGRFSGSGNFSGFFGAQGWSNLVSTTYSNLALAFTSPVQAVGGYVGRIPNFTDEHPSAVVVELFDSSLASLGSATIGIPAAFNSPVFFGFTADAGISRLEIRVNNSGFIGVDNVTFGTLVVPEPSTLAMGGTAALFGLGAAWRRRRRVAFPCP
jgi:hypothetical protein